MLRNTFLHVRGVGERTERRLWEAGVWDWDEFLRHPRKAPAGERLRRGLAEEIDLSGRRLKAGDAGFFSRKLPARHAWRLYREFEDECAFLDVETDPRALTAVGVWMRGEMRFFVRGVNLDELPGVLDEARVLVTYNGKCFDLPVLRRELGLRLDGAHIDLRYVLAPLGLRGGLKAVEGHLGLERSPEVEGLDGWDAVRLWHEHSPGSLRQLLLYNAFDVLQLEPILRYACNAWLERLGMPAERFDLRAPAPAAETAREAAELFIPRIWPSPEARPASRRREAAPYRPPP